MKLQSVGRVQESFIVFSCRIFRFCSTFFSVGNCAKATSKDITNVATVAIMRICAQLSLIVNLFKVV